MTRFQIRACQVSPVTRSIFGLKSLFTPQSCGIKSHYQSRHCQPALMTAGNLGNPVFLCQIFLQARHLLQPGGGFPTLTACLQYKCQTKSNFSTNIYLLSLYVITLQYIVFSFCEKDIQFFLYFSRSFLKYQFSLYALVGGSIKYALSPL